MKQIREEDLAKAMLTLQDDMTVENMSKDFKRILSALQDCHCDDYQNSFKFMDDEMKENKRSADRLAYECARRIQMNHIDSRSGIGDALLDYLKIGGIDGCDSVPQWMKEYEQSLPEAGGKEE